MSLKTSRRPVYVREWTPSTPTQDVEDLELKRFHQALPFYSPTPLVSLDRLAKELNVKAVFVKDESSRFGLPSFKLLGASWGVFRAVAAKTGLSTQATLEDVSLAAQRCSITLFAATDGNHGRAIAYMAKILHLPAEIYVPQTVDEYTRALIIAEGARLVIVPNTYDTAVAAATSKAAGTLGGVLVQDTAFEGYETIPAWIIDGYSTLMQEIGLQVADKDMRPTMIIAPVGVGSLAQAVVNYSKAPGRDIQVVAVEPDTSACLYKSLHAGKALSVETSHTIMNGMDCGTVSSTAWPILRDHVDISVTISDYETHEAVQYLTAEGLNVGPCGASGLAALRRLSSVDQEGVTLDPDSVIVLLSTEASRPYPVPVDVRSEDPVVLTRALTTIDSSNPSLSVTEGAGEEKVANYISAWLEHRDIEIHRIEPILGRPSVVGVVRGSGGGKSLMLNGHIDTVSLTTYDGDGLSGHLSKDRVYGRGTLDMKAGVAAAMVALSKTRMSPAELRGDVILAAVADEEYGSQGTLDVLNAGWTADGAIVTEPTILELGYAHKGFVWVELDITGIAAHGSDPTAGVDAIFSTAAFLAALERYSKRLPSDGALGQASLHCGTIKGGEEPSSYPALCTTTIEFRTVPGQTTTSIVEDLEELLEGIAAHRQGFSYSKPRVTFERPVLSSSVDHPFVQAAVSTASDVLKTPLTPKALPFWCDAALLSDAGIPAVVFGPSGEGIHSKEEWVDAESIRQVEGVLSAVIGEFCA